MAYLYGATYSRADLLARVGDISQIARVKPYRLTEGLEDGVFALDVTNGSGLDFTLLPSRGLDISTARYNGRAIAWRSATTDAHPAYFDHEGEGGRGWLRGFYGGLLVTCGLTYAGAGGEDQGQLYGLHGRVSNLPATNVQWDGAWDGDEYWLTVSGKVRQATVFGENIQLTRTVRVPLGRPVFYLQDVVENLAPEPTEHMMLYHINLGFPLVHAGSRLLAPSRAATPRDADARDGQEQWGQFGPPEPNYREKVYLHDLAPNPRDANRVTTAIVNPELTSGADGGKGLGVYCAYDPAQLPRFIEWKMTGQGTYVVGMEPANCSVMGRAKEREAGRLQVLAPGERREYALEIGILENGAEIAALETVCRDAAASVSLAAANETRRGASAS